MMRQPSRDTPRVHWFRKPVVGNGFRSCRTIGHLPIHVDLPEPDKVTCEMCVIDLRKAGLR